MKNLFIICLVLIGSIFLCSFTVSNINIIDSTTETISNSWGTEFNKGFEDGWCEGWEDVKGSLSMCPMSPMPKMGQSSDSYRDGYNTGFKAGMRKTHNSY